MHCGEVTLFSLLLAQLSDVLWPSLSAFPSSNTVCGASFLLISITHSLSLLPGKSVALISPVIRLVTEKVACDN